MCRCGGEPAVGGNDRGEGEETSVAGDEPHEIGDDYPGIDAAEDRVHRRRLVVGGDHRRAQETREIGALVDEPADGGEIGLDGLDMALLAGQFIKRIGVGLRDMGHH